MNNKVKAKYNKSYGILTLISVLFPLIGIILGIFYLTKDGKVDKKLGKHLVAISILSMIIWSVASFIFLVMSTPVPSYNY